jgi:DNA-binding CsgD family transcriptional regulator
MVRAPQVEPRATGAAVSQRERFAGRTAELLEWHRAGRPGDLHADLEAGTLAIRNLGHTAGDLERKTLSTPATGQRRRRRGSSRRTRRLALSRREREALGLVSQRLTDPEIAVLFVLSSRTVEAHVSRVLHQLGAANRRAAAIAARHGLIWRWRQDGIRVRFRFGAGGSAWPGNVAIRPTRHSWHTWHTSPAVMASTGRW